jgi:hypothetical protein
LFSFAPPPFFAVLVDNDELSLFFEGETLLPSSALDDAFEDNEREESGFNCYGELE